MKILLALKLCEVQKHRLSLKLVQLLTRSSFILQQIRHFMNVKTLKNFKYDFIDL